MTLKNWSYLLLFFLLRTPRVWSFENNLKPINPIPSYKNLDLNTIKIPQAFLNLYQYKTDHPSKNQSAILSPYFFISPQGAINPLEEFKAVFEALMNDKPMYGIQKTFASCAFPARKKILEKSLNLQFPPQNCSDLIDWKNQLQAHKASIVFAGAFSGNPASIMGHTFLRLSHRDERFGNPLLSYAVGFMAHPDSKDSSLMYMAKGLTGQYMGGYEIEPYYQKVGLYNNSESRDIWEYTLNLDESEVSDLVDVLWELTFNAQIPYFFLDRNCSFQLLKLIEVVRPDLRLTSKSSFIVLPAETVRTLTDNQLTRNLSYRSSLKTKLEFKKSQFSPEQLKYFNLAAENQTSISRIQDPQILDALIDHWNIKNYQSQTQLSETDRNLMDETLKTRSLIAQKSPLIEETTLESFSQIHPPFLGHKPSRLKWGVSTTNLNLNDQIKITSHILQFEMRAGVHNSDDVQLGYEKIKNLEYLKFNLSYLASNKNLTASENKKLLPEKTYSKRKDQLSLLQGRLTFIEALSLNDFSLKEWSWGFKAFTSNQCLNCTDSNLELSFIGYGGISKSLGHHTFFILPAIKSQTEIEEWNQTRHEYWIGGKIGYLYSSKILNFESAIENFYSREKQEKNLSLKATKSFNLNHQIQGEFTSSNTDFFNEEPWFKKIGLSREESRPFISNIDFKFSYLFNY